MTTWNSRIILRHDADWTLDDTANIDYSLAKGEVGAQITGEFIDVRIGIASEGTMFSDCIVIYEGRIGVESLPLSVEVPEGSGLDDGTMLRWDPATSRFVPDAEPIAWNTSAASGAVIYTNSTYEWSTDTALTVITDADGGTFTGSFVAPSFSESYDPAIGEP